MKQWEYEVVEINFPRRASLKKQSDEFARFRDRLNELGAQGWEMIGYAPDAVTSGPQYVLAVFKRERST